MYVNIYQQDFTKEKLMYMSTSRNLIKFNKMTSQEYELLPDPVKNIVDSWDEDMELYTEAKRIRRELEDIGWTCEYGLDGMPYDVKPKKKLEMTKEQILDKYGEVVLKFTNYFKYEFYFLGVTENGTQIFTSIGGTSCSIYNIDVSSDAKETLLSLEPEWVSITFKGKELASYDER